jgi:hypothetical protein
MRALAWIVWLGLALPLGAQAHGPPVGGPGAPPHGVGRHAQVEVWVPLALESEPAPSPCRGGPPVPPPEAGPGRRWHAGPACGSAARYRVVDRPAPHTSAGTP